jgi:hypothetical protein
MISTKPPSGEILVAFSLITPYKLKELRVDFACMIHASVPYFSPGTIYVKPGTGFL